MGMVELEVMLCIRGDDNTHMGVVLLWEEECCGKFCCGPKNINGQKLLELVARNGMAIAGSFFQKWESHKIAERSGHHRTEVNLVVMRKQQLWRVKDCKTLAGEHAPPSTSLWCLWYA